MRVSTECAAALLSFRYPSLFIYFELEYEKLLSCVAFITPYNLTGRYEILNTFYRCAFASIVLSLYGHAKKN